MYSALSTSRSFAASGALGASNATLSSYAASIISNVSTAASTASSKATTTATALTTLQSQFSSESGVNSDQESATLVSLENNYAASAKVISAEIKGADLNLVIFLPAVGARYLIEKGSIAVNGVSLTVASLSPDRFGLWIIPHTLQETNLGDLQAGSLVNLEYDMLAKYAERQLAAP